MQRGLRQGPGLESAIVVWRLSGGARLERARDAALGLVEALSPLAADSVVGLSARLLGLDAFGVLPRERNGWRFPQTGGDVFLQVAAESRGALLEALRRAGALVEGRFTLDEELFGGRIADGREPFGFRDGLRAPTSEELDALAMPSGPLAGGTFLLYLRLVQRRDAFAALPPPRQARIIGRTPEGEPVVPASEGAHVPNARTKGLVRRGFPFRAAGQEGLAFVGAAASTRIFEGALDRMLGVDGAPDALLSFIDAAAGGVYLAPGGAR